MGYVNRKPYAAAKGYVGSLLWTVADSFARTDGLISAGNPNWVAVGTMPTILTNRLRLGPASTTKARWATPPGLTRVYSRLNYLSSSGGTGLSSGPMLMMSAGGNFYQASGADQSGFFDRQIQIVRCVSGGTTVMVSGALAADPVFPFTPDGLRVPGPVELRAVVSAVDVTLTFLQNGIVMLTAVDAAANRLTVGDVGFGSGTSDGLRSAFYDSFRAGAF